MVSGMWGRKIGMTQIFVEDKVVPVTAIDLNNWIISDIKTQERDGYNAIQVSQLKKRYSLDQFKKEWLKSKKKYFLVSREIKTAEKPDTNLIGKIADFRVDFEAGNKVDIFGVSKGRGFAGVVKRHGFGGPPASHGSTMGKRPGSIGSITAKGKVFKRKKMPGHMGAENCFVKDMRVVQVDAQNNVLFVKGGVPGYSGSLVFMRKVKVGL